MCLPLVSSTWASPSVKVKEGLRSRYLLTLPDDGVSVAGMSVIVMVTGMPSTLRSNSQAILPKYLRYLRCLGARLELVLTCDLSSLQQWHVITIGPASFGVSLVYLTASTTVAAQLGVQVHASSLRRLSDHHLFPPGPGTYDFRHNWLPVLRYSPGFVSQCLHIRKPRLCLTYHRVYGAI